MSLTTDPNDPNLHKKGPDGQNLSYLILSDEERDKGFVRPLRRGYIHLKCKSLTTMGLALSETYAAQPSFYGATYCCACQDHFHLLDSEGKRTFVWNEDGTGVGE